jgi:hypothetical protein
MEILEQLPASAPSVGLIKAATLYDQPENPWKYPGESRPVQWTYGVQVRGVGCEGVHPHPLGRCVDGACCNNTGTELVINDPTLDWVQFHPFALRKAMCVSGACAPELLAAMELDLALYRGPAVGRAFHSGIDGNPGLRNSAVSVTSTAVGSLEGLGLLLEARANHLVGGGWLHIPPVAAPHLAGPLAAMAGGFGASPFGATIIDFGYQNLAPGTGLTAPAPGTAWVYVSNPVVVAIGSDPLTKPGPVTGDSQYFWDRTKGCFMPIVDRLALYAFQPCNTFAALIDLRILDL